MNNNKMKMLSPLLICLRGCYGICLPCHSYTLQQGHKLYETSVRLKLTHTSRYTHVRGKGRGSRIIHGGLNNSGLCIHLFYSE